MPNSLTRTAGLKLGPIALDTLFKHYFDRVKKEKAGDEVPFTRLRQDELLYDEAFNIAKRFFDVATQHPVEELQAFSNARTISPPSVHVARVTVPMSCCDEAATLLIQTLGGGDHVSHLLGGTKWWQVRGVTGIPGEWITAKKDWAEAKKRQKASKKKEDSNDSSRVPEGPLPSSVSEPSDLYDEDADKMRCILYIHGGGYYFGSVDQERHCVQRLARKIKGRAFAVNYRLAPQYPFPCALQDILAAYLYLIRPPPDAPHQPVKPSHIVVAGDSAGGGLALALLQVLRDSRQPLPAGGVLVSPWCDLTHSFPSIHTNTDTDVLPVYGLSLHKPSTLWPPPSQEMTRNIHTGIRQRVRQFVENKTSEASEPTRHALPGPKHCPSFDDAKRTLSGMPVDVGATTALPSVDEETGRTITLLTKSGEQLRVDSQIQLYAENSLLGHPLVSPAISYLGGLPPLFIIASEKEVLRDEIIYSAHKAAYPSKFATKDEALALYPPLVGIGERYGPTQVHLQIYDDTAHVVPILFPFTTPGKYCYRAIATFIKHITGILDPMVITPSSSELPASPSQHPMGGTDRDGASAPRVLRVFSKEPITESPPALDNSRSTSEAPTLAPDSSNPHPPFSRSRFFSFGIKSAQAPMPRSISERSLRRAESSFLRPQEDQYMGSPNKLRRSTSMIDTAGVRYAGEPSVYYSDEGLPTWTGGMIRERVSTQGIIRPLEPDDKLDALRVPPEIIGVLSEKALRRYLEGKALFDEKYAKQLLSIEKQRNRNLDLARKDISKNLAHFQELQNGREPKQQRKTFQGLKDGLASSTGALGWAWADERPPPSSIVSRRDTDESRRLARIACSAVLQDEGQANNGLWAAIINLTTTSPSKKHCPLSDSEIVETPVEQTAIKKSKSMFASFRIREKQ